MSLRTWLSVAGVFVSGGVCAYLLSTEEIATGDEVAEFVARKADPLIDMAFTSSNRKANFEAFGMDAELVTSALDMARRYEDTGKVDRLRLLMKGATEPVELADALCGADQSLRPRYGALRFLVAEVQGERRPVDLDRVSSLQREDWSKTSPIVAVYNDAELAQDRKADATLMAIAAILAAQEQELLNGYKPWGRGLAATWSWKQVKKKIPGIEKRTIEYLVMMHLAVEVANEEAGICE
jgi:hypothetical protein